MASFSSVPLIVTAGLETVGVFLLALEVWIGHRVEEIGEELSQVRRLQFFFTAQDYRSFWIEWRLQKGRPTSEVTSMVNLLGPTELENAVRSEWTTGSANVDRGLRRWEKYTTPAARLTRKISLATGTLLILTATWLSFLREASNDHAAPRSVSQQISLAPYRVSPFPSGVASDPSGALADEICRVRKAQDPSGTRVAVVIGRHDPVPLTPAAKKRFGSNLGLAQERAETVARMLLDPKVCPNSPPIEAIALAAPNGHSAVGKPQAALTEERRPDVLGLVLALQSEH